MYAVCLSLLSPATVSVEAATAIKISSAPKGFESLTEPQTTLVDVFYAGRAVVSTLATYTDDTITIANPLEVVSNIPKVKESDALVRSLTGELTSNTDFVCPEITQKVSAEVRRALLADCGRLSPKVAAVIFDESKFRLDVYVHPDYLHVYELGLTKFLPESDADESLMTSFSGAMSGTDETKNTYSLSNQSIVAVGEGRLRLKSDYTSTDQWIMDTFTGELDRNDQRFTVGAMRTRSMDTIGEFKMLGGRYTTTTDTRIDLGVGFGSQLVVFLPRDAQVDILKDGRLIATKFYQAGKTTLFTEALPDGAYDVTLRIKEAGGVTREETRFYVKTATLPPADQPLYFLESGVLLSEDSPPYPELNKVGLIHGGAFWRLTENLGAGGDILAGENVIVGEARGLYLGRDMKLNFAGVVSSDLDLGVTLGATGEIWDTTYSLSVRRNWSREKSSTNATFDPMNRSFTQARASLNYQWGELQMSLLGQSQTNDNADDTWSVGPSFAYPLFRNAQWGANMRAEATRSESESVAMARVQIRFNEPRWSASATSSITNNNSETSASSDNEGISGDGSANLAWHDLDLLPGDLTVGVGTTAEKRRRSLSGEIDYLSRWGKYSFDGENNWGGTTRSTRWGGNIATSVLTDGGVVAFGGRERQDSGIVVSLDGSSRNAEFNVMVNGASKGIVKVGDRIPVLLSPYNTYVVRLEPTGGDFVSYDAENRDITLYPGNIVGITWSINPIVAVFGRVIRKDGTPVTFARVDGAGKGTFTDDLGYFQAELNKPGTFTVRPTDADACEIVVAALPPDQDFADLKDLICTDILLEAKKDKSDKDENTITANAGEDGKQKEFDWSPVISAYKSNIESKNKSKKSAPEKAVASVSTEDKEDSKPVQVAAAIALPDQVAPVQSDTDVVKSEPATTTSETEATTSIVATAGKTVGTNNQTSTPKIVEAEIEVARVEPVETGPIVASIPVPEVAVAAPAQPTEIANSAEVSSAVEEIATLEPSVPERSQPTNLLAGIPGVASESPGLVGSPPAYRVQLVALRRPDRLLAAWRDVAGKASGRLDNFSAYMARADLGDRGTFFRLQTGDAPDRKTASELCEDLRNKGLTCRVVKAATVATNTSGKSFCTLAGPSSWAPSCSTQLVRSASLASSDAGAASGLSSRPPGPKTREKAKKELDVRLPDYRVQLGSHLTAQDAIEDWRRIEGLSEGFLSGLEPQVAEVDLKRRGIWFRLQVRVPEGRIAARNLCDNLADLSVSCLVVRKN
ncbi:MAG: hypothetical protein HOE83_05995 [Alphaproteobacteria bacterium]|nr:hypothetical protein [Alphaproteobacteria bacterium]